LYHVPLLAPTISNRPLLASSLIWALIVLLLVPLIGIKQDLEEQLNCPVDIVRYRDRMNEFLKKRIDKEAVYV